MRKELHRSLEHAPIAESPGERARETSASGTIAHSIHFEEPECEGRYRRACGGFRRDPRLLAAFRRRFPSGDLQEGANARQKEAASMNPFVVGDHLSQYVAPVVRLRSCTSAHTHFVPEMRIDDETLYSLEERASVTRWRGKTVHTVIDEIVASSCICHHDRQPRRKCLECHVAESLGVARKQKNVRRCICCRQILARQASRKDSAWQRFFQVSPLRSVTNNQCTMTDVLFAKQLQHPYYNIESLLGDQSADERDDRRVDINPPRFTPFIRA